ncbi:hypothetical protein [Paraburkholderia humisilvae]|nr:hypothetical protein [Paraburkholderia humisilvae]
MVVLKDGWDFADDPGCGTRGVDTVREAEEITRSHNIIEAQHQSNDVSLVATEEPTDPASDFSGSHTVRREDNGLAVAVLSGYNRHERATYARQMAAAPILLRALRVLQANPNDPRAHRTALDAIALATDV